MHMWPDAVASIQAGSPDSPVFDRRRFVFGDRQHVVITGRSGAGKTRLWSTLTGVPPLNRMSVTTDDGYMISRNRRSLALITVPGQNSAPRHASLEILFNSRARVSGVIFVASAGYDHIWHDMADIVAEDLRNNWTYDMNGLRERNLQHERDGFREICERVATKFEYSASPTLRPKWLLVLVNKADLYFPDRSSVESYYLPGCGSLFDKHRAELFARIGNTGLRYYVLPLVSEISPYRFQPSSGALSHPSHLAAVNRNASLKILADNMEELYDV